MFMTRPVLCVAIALAPLASGCTSQQMYATGQAYQRNRCLEIPDQRGDCMSQSPSYEEYKRETVGPNR